MECCVVVVTCPLSVRSLPIRDYLHFRERQSRAWGLTRWRDKVSSCHLLPRPAWLEAPEEAGFLFEDTEPGWLRDIM